MTIRSEISRNSVPTARTFPALMESTVEPGLLVLFVDEEFGTILASPDTDEEIGAHMAFDIVEFVDFDGVLTLGDDGSDAGEAIDLGNLVGCDLSQDGAGAQCASQDPMDDPRVVNAVTALNSALAEVLGGRIVGIQIGVIRDAG